MRMNINVVSYTAAVVALQRNTHGSKAERFEPPFLKPPPRVCKYHHRPSHDCSPSPLLFTQAELIPIPGGSKIHNPQLEDHACYIVSLR